MMNETVMASCNRESKLAAEGSQPPVVRICFGKRKSNGRNLKAECKGTASECPHAMRQHEMRDRSSINVSITSVIV